MRKPRQAAVALHFPVARVMLSATFLTSAVRHVIHWCAAVLAHNFWAMLAAKKSQEPIEYLNNLAMATSALPIVLNGAGSFTLDAAKGRRPSLRDNVQTNALTTEFK